MKNILLPRVGDHTIFRSFLFLVIISTLSFSVSAQSTGYINRPATIIAGRTVLDPNGDGYTSQTSAGFAGNDVANSEIPYRSVPSFSKEPFGDLRRGPSHLYSDFVPDANNIGYYFYYDGTNLLFRMRMGSIMAGSKGYSVLLDTDGKFGATGANADPNYLPATTGTNGNQGFEIEIVLETNFRVAIYNVDGSNSPTLVKAYTNWQDMSQVSVAGTFDNGDPDFFIDFYIPFSDLQAAPFNLTTTTPLRMIATTVMSPQAAIGGPKSDLYGLDDSGFKSTSDEYEAYINAQPQATVTGNFGAMCTAAPVVNAPISSGTVNISGTWTKSPLAGAVSSAAITVYKNGVSIGTITNVISGGTWTLNNIALVNGDIITAKALASGESMCLISNSVKASSCNATNRPLVPVLSCYSTSKGITGTNLRTGWTVHVDNVTRSTTDDNATNSNGLFSVPTGSSPNLTWMYSSGCSSGSPLISGSYKVYYLDDVSGCASEPAYVCVAGNGGSVLAGSVAAPVITSPLGGILTTGTSSISGTADANTLLSLCIDGAIAQTTTAPAGGSFTFSNLALLTGQQVYIVSELNTGTVSTSKCEAQSSKITVTCYTTPPLINVDNNNQLTSGQAINGTSSEPVGTTIKVYTSANAAVSTSTVQNGGIWTTSPYTAIAGTSYYATAQNGTCGLSTASATFAAAAPTTARCGTISTPVTAASNSVSGTLTGSVANTTVNLYVDGIKIGAVITSNSTWSINSSSFTYPLYSNGVLSIGVQESTKQEQYCSASQATISCNTGPVTPVISPASSTIVAGQTQTYTISNAVTGVFYGIADANSGQSLGNGVWASSSTVNLTTKSFNSGTYTVAVKGTSLSGVSVCSSPSASASVVVNSTLPLKLLEFSGIMQQNIVALNWVTAQESNVDYFDIERSEKGLVFTSIGTVQALNVPEKNNYNLLDRQPLPTNYYRLKMVDRDGHYTYSKVLLIKNGAVNEFKVLPNPFNTSVTITCNLPVAQNLWIEMLTLDGKTVFTKAARTVKGSNSIMLNVQNLQQGYYYLKIRNEMGDLFSVQKLVKP